MALTDSAVALANDGFDIIYMPKVAPQDVSCSDPCYGNGTLSTNKSLLTLKYDKNCDPGKTDVACTLTFNTPDCFVIVNHFVGGAWYASDKFPLKECKSNLRSLGGNKYKLDIAL